MGHRTCEVSRMNFKMGFSLFLFFTIVVYTNGQGAVRNCQYSFTVPDKQGVCTSGAAGMDKRITAVKQDLDRQRLQVMAQNSLFQRKINQLETVNQAQASLISGLQNDLQQLRSAFTSLTTGTGSGPTPQSLQQLIYNTRNDMNTMSNNFNDKLLNLTTEMARAAIAETKVNSAIQTQVVSQSVDLGRATQRIVTLENQVQNLQRTGIPGATTPSSGATISPSQLTRLENRIRAVDRDVKQIDQMGQQQFATLNQKTNLALLTINNHTREIDDAKIASRAAVARIQTAETTVRTLRTTFVQFRGRIDPQVQRMVTDVAILQSNTTYIQTEVTGVGSRLLNMQVQTSRDIGNLQTGNSLLATQISGLLNTSKAQAGEVLQLRIDVNRLNNTARPGSGATSGPGPTAATPTSGISTTAFTQLQTQFGLFRQIAMQQLAQTRTDLQNLAARVTSLTG